MVSTGRVRPRHDRGLGRDFRSLWFGSGVSNMGDGLRIAALPLHAVSLTDSPFEVAAVTTAQFVPWLVFAPVGGAVVDRSRRRETIMWTQGWRALVMLLLGIAVLADAAALWHLYVVGALTTVGEILVDPAVGAMVPALVDHDDLEAANSRILGTEIVTNEFAGGPLGSAAYTLAPWLPFVGDALTYGASILWFRRLPRVPAYRPEVASRLRTEIADGARWLWRHDFLGKLAVVMGIANFGAVASMALLVLLVTDVLAGSDIAFGMILAVGAVGAFIGAATATRLAVRIGRRTVLVGALLAEAIVMFFVAAAPSIPALALLWLLMAIPTGLWMPVSRALQQRITPNHLLGRVNTTTRVLTRGSMVFGSLAMGALATVTNVRLAIVTGAAIDLAAGVMLWLLLRGRDIEPPVKAAA